MCARDDEEELEDEFEARVRRQRELIEKGRREKGQSFWRYVGLIGAVGWSVVVPMALGVLLGLWLDRKFQTGSRWTLALLLLGLSVGCLNAWRTITKEQ
ncbi:AtpZ/AtpI family protein [bacterium]|nr:AtpZ/AtpI family protein [bacterium]